MYTKEELSTLVEDYVQGLQFPQTPETLYAPIVYSLESGGKRIRPLLAMMACNIFSDSIDGALPAAVAVEVFHNFTLLHDDIMDNATVRRGKPAVHRKWGENVAILSGDVMMIYAYGLLEKIDPALLSGVFRVFNDMSMKVCEGQQYDMDFESLENVYPHNYINMIKLKTAALMSGATLIGAMCGGADADDLQKLETFATELGIAFQIQDDILDSYGTEKVLGKKIGGDILEGKKTYLMTTALQAADEPTRIRLSGLMHNREMLPEEKIREVLDIYDRLNVRHVAEQAVELYTSRAIKALESLSVPSARIAPIRALAFELTKRIN